MLAFRREMFASLFGDERIAKYSEVRKALVHDVLLMPRKIFSHCASFVKYLIVKKIPPNLGVSRKKNATEMFLVKDLLNHHPMCYLNANY